MGQYPKRDGPLSRVDMRKSHQTLSDSPESRMSRVSPEATTRIRVLSPGSVLRLWTESMVEVKAECFITYGRCSDLE